MGESGKKLDEKAFDVLFRDARTYNGWLDQPVSDETIKAAYDLAKWGPTSANCSPMRFVVVRSKEAKEKLKPHMDKGNLEKTMAAPATILFAYDFKFYENLPKLFPHTDAKSWFVGKPDYIKESAWRNGTLQAAYFMLAARSMGLDCGPMSGFKKAGVRQAFFPGSETIEVNFLCNIGYGDPASLHARGPRFEFDESCAIV